MAFVLTVIGLLLVGGSLAAVAFGLFMAADPKNREQGKLFAIWWVPGVAAASGVLMKDVVTFTIGLLCFLVAGTVFFLADMGSGKATVKRRRGSQRRTGERTTRENEADRGYDEAAS